MFRSMRWHTRRDGVGSAEGSANGGPVRHLASRPSIAPYAPTHPTEDGERDGKRIGTMAHGPVGRNALQSFAAQLGQAQEWGQAGLGRLPQDETQGVPMKVDGTVL